MTEETRDLLYEALKVNPKCDQAVDNFEKSNLSVIH